MKSATTGLGLQASLRIGALAGLVLFLTLASRSTAGDHVGLLSADERRWLARHPVIRLAPEASYAPFTFVDDRGRHRGISADYMELIERKLGIRFVVVGADDLNENLKKARRGDVDVLTSLKATPEREKFLLFTRSYIEVPAAIIVRKEISGTLALKDMQGFIIAVGAGYGVHEYLAGRYPFLQLAPQRNDSECLQKLSFAEVSAAAVDLASASHTIQKLGLANLRVAGLADYTYDLSLASRRDWPELNAVLEKALASISSAEHEAIRHRWITVDYDAAWMRPEFQRFLLGLAAVAVCILAAAIMITMVLRRQVALRTRELCRELDERARAESALQNSLERLRAYFYLPLIGIVTVNAEKGWLEINPRLCSMLGYSEQELRAKTWREITPVEDQAPEQEMYAKVFSGEISLPYTFEKRYRKKDGGIIITEVAIDTTKNAETGEDCFIAFIQDITARKQAEQDLLRTNEELVSFTYAVSHDLRSPLVTINTFLGYLERNIAGGNTKDVERDMGYIHAAADRMSSMLDELLNLSRIGRMEASRVEIPLQDLVREVLGVVAGQIEARGVGVRVSGEPVVLYGDRARLVEVFQNLIDNAVKFMGDQSGPFVEITWQVMDDRVMVSVRDNGMGIDPKYQDKLFGLFVRLNSNVEGAGLGLALVKRIVEAHGGRIWAESGGPGRGTCFRLLLPRCNHHVGAAECNNTA